MKQENPAFRSRCLDFFALEGQALPGQLSLLHYLASDFLRGLLARLVLFNNSLLRFILSSSCGYLADLSLLWILQGCSPLVVVAVLEVRCSGRGPDGSRGFQVGRKRVGGEEDIHDRSEGQANIVKVSILSLALFLQYPYRAPSGDHLIGDREHGLVARSHQSVHTSEAKRP